MAEEVQIRGTSSTAKIRGVVAVTVLSIITLGIYGLVWYYKVNREMADLGKATGRVGELGDSPGRSLLAITLGALIIVPALISYAHTFKRVQALQRLTGASGPINGWIGFILFIVFSPAFLGYMQSGLNSAWRAQSSGEPGGEVAEQPA
jgi:Domain of unknown function (DUF4234)